MADFGLARLMDETKRVREKVEKERFTERERQRERERERERERVGRERES